MKLLLLGVSSLIGLLLVEMGVRWFLPFYAPASQIGFVATTNGIALGPANQSSRQATPKGDFDVISRFNADGFRDVKDLRTAGPADWFALGDSFTMGWGVQEEERFSNQLEKALAGSGSAIRVFNIAIPENIIGYQRLLRYAEGRGARVNHLLIGICMENDLRDYSDGHAGWDFVFGANGVVPTKGKGPFSLRGFLKGHSALYNALSFGLQRSPTFRRLFEKAGISRDVIQLSGRNEWDEKIIQSSATELIKLVAERDARVLIIPARGLWAGDNRATELRVHEAFIDLLKKANLQVLDLKPALDQTGEPLAYYFKSDPHWNPKGHALAAKELSKALSAAPNQ